MLHEYKMAVLKIDINVPRSTSRHATTFKIPRCRTDTYKNSPIIRCMALANKFLRENPEVDVMDGRSRKKLISALKNMRE